MPGNSIHIPGIGFHMPGIFIHITSEFLFTSLRNPYPHVPEYALPNSRYALRTISLLSERKNDPVARYGVLAASCTMNGCVVCAALWGIAWILG